MIAKLVVYWKQQYRHTLHIRSYVHLQAQVAFLGELLKVSFVENSEKVVFMPPRNSRNKSLYHTVKIKLGWCYSAILVVGFLCHYANCTFPLDWLYQGTSSYTYFALNIVLQWASYGMPKVSTLRNDTEDLIWQNSLHMLLIDLFQKHHKYSYILFIILYLMSKQLNEQFISRFRKSMLVASRMLL